MKFSTMLPAGLLAFWFAGGVSATPLLWESDYGTWSDLSDEDDETEKYNLGFDFTFYGASYDSVYINSNGALQFDAFDYDYEVGNDIEDHYGRVIAPFWADLDASEGGNIYYNTLGTAGDRRFVVTWDDVIDHENEFNNTFQAVLFENGSIQFGYESLLGSGDDAGKDVIGVSQGDGTNYNYSIAADGDSGGIYPNGRNLFYNWNSTSLNYDISNTHTHSVPEPSTVFLLGAGFVGLLFRGRRKMKGSLI